MTKDSGQPDLKVCPIQSTGGAVSEVEGVLSVSFISDPVYSLIFGGIKTTVWKKLKRKGNKLFDVNNDKLLLCSNIHSKSFQCVAIL